MSELRVSLKDQLAEMESLIADAVGLWDIPKPVDARLINVSENMTYLLDGPLQFKAVLRVHRTGYHSRRAIECELAWLDALAIEAKVSVPRYFVGFNGHAIQQIRSPSQASPHYAVLFHFLEGRSPEISDHLEVEFQTLGMMAARCHTHAISWKRPEPFERLAWDTETVFGTQPTWGDWRRAPNVTTEIRETLEAVEQKVCARLEAYGKSPERYNLIHADMRLANLLTGSGETHVIDFDDCGFGWFMYDFAAAISFIEDDPCVPAIKAAWIEGYRTERYLTETDEAEIETFVMLRRMALLAWIGSHLEAPEPRKYATNFARKTAELGRKYLERHQ